MYCYLISCSLVCTVSAFCQSNIPYEGVQDSYERSFKEHLLALDIDHDIVKRLFCECMIVEQADDSVLRPKYVSVQAAFEQILAQELKLGRLKQVVAVIHTPLPATPLCMEGEIAPGLVDTSLAKDEKRLYTVSKRSETLRALLQSGGTLMAAYPVLSRALRSPSQLAVFEGLLKKYVKNFFDAPMGCLEVAPEMIGATYIFETMQGEWLMFSIRFTQDISPQDPTSVGMWFGSVNKGPAAERLAQVSAYLRACQGPDLISYIFP